MKAFDLLRDISYFLPFSPFRGIVWSFLDKKSSSILDIGCGKGEVTRAINLHRKRSFRIGVEIFASCAKYCKEEKVYDDCVISDIRYLPFRKKSFDSILCIEVIEHLEKNDGLQLINDLEEIARRQVIISTPVIPFRLSSKEFDLDEFDGNVFQIHKSVWSPGEFRKQGYKVIGELPIIPLIPKGRFLAWFLPLICLVYFTPNKASSILCVKNISPGEV